MMDGSNEAVIRGGSSTPLDYIVQPGLLRNDCTLKLFTCDMFGNGCIAMCG